MVTNVIVGELDGKKSADQDSDDSKEGDEQYSCGSQKLMQGKEATNSESDECEPEEKKASLNKAVSQESSPIKVVYDFQGSKSFNQLIHSPGSGVSVHLPLKHDFKGMLYFLVLLPRSNEIWWMDAKFLQGVVNCVHEDEKSNTHTPLWLKTFEKYVIRSEPHGNNSYKRDDRKRFIEHIGFFL